MATFIMFGRYSAQAMEGMSAERTVKAEKLAAKFGGKIKAGYAMLGQKDLLIITDFPGVEQAMQASVAFSKMTGIAVTTSPAVTIDEFDKLVAEI